jgi:hypothetical protein
MKLRRVIPSQSVAEPPKILSIVISLPGHSVLTLESLAKQVAGLEVRDTISSSRPRVYPMGVQPGNLLSSCEDLRVTARSPVSRLIASDRAGERAKNFRITSCTIVIFTQVPVNAILVERRGIV